ncbi:MAG: hypothetical protein QM733_01300 [Ilumatobacteraceae bacterium]
MGLFGKGKASLAELVALQGDVCALRARLDQAELARESLARQLAAARADARGFADQAAVDGRFEEIERRFGCITPLARRIEEMRAQLSELRGALDETRERVDALPDPHERFGALHRRIDLLPDHTDSLNELQARLDKLPEHGPALDAQAARLDEIGSQLGAIDGELARLATESTAHGELAASLAALDRRMVAAARGIDERLTGLAGDLDALAVSSPAVVVTPEQVDELRAGQIRLANEQTRFQIAVREDVAVLAEQLGRNANR